MSKDESVAYNNLNHENEVITKPQQQNEELLKIDIKPIKDGELIPAFWADVLLMQHLS